MDTEKKELKLGKGRIAKLRNAIVNNDDIKHMVDFAWHGVLMPLFEQTFKAYATNTMNSIFNTNISPNSLGSYKVNSEGKVDYTAPSKSSELPRSNTQAAAKKAILPNEWYDISFATEKEADEAMGKIMETFDNYSRLTVADYASCCEREAEFTCQKYGWHDITGIRKLMVQKSNGDIVWKIQMPSRAKEL